MHKIKKVYICDACGKVELSRTKYEMTPLGDIIKTRPLPSDWAEIGKVHYCPVCHEVYRRVLQEAREELRLAQEGKL